MQIGRPVAHAEPASPLVFVHIPKTAGTTLNAILADRYSADEIHEVMMRGMSLIVPEGTMRPTLLVSRSKLRRLQTALARRDRVRVINGHLDMSLARLLPPGAQYLTLLRNPVERALSHYRHYRSLAHDPIHPLALRSTLIEWVSARGLVEMDNGQTRRLAGEMGLPVGAVSAQTLDRAKANLAGKFALIGLTERFEEFQVLLHRRFNWPYLRYPARNVGDARVRQSEPDTEALRVVEHCNRYDLELYRFGSELFERAAREVDMKRELALLKAAPEHVAPVRTMPPQQAYVITRSPSFLERLLRRRAIQGGAADPSPIPTLPK